MLYFEICDWNSLDLILVLGSSFPLVPHLGLVCRSGGVLGYAIYS